MYWFFGFLSLLSWGVKKNIVSESGDVSMNISPEKVIVLILIVALAIGIVIAVAVFGIYPPELPPLPEL